MLYSFSQETIKEHKENTRKKEIKKTLEKFLKNTLSHNIYKNKKFFILDYIKEEIKNSEIDYWNKTNLLEKIKNLFLISFDKQIYFSHIRNNKYPIIKRQNKENLSNEREQIKHQIHISTDFEKIKANFDEMLKVLEKQDIQFSQQEISQYISWLLYHINTSGIIKDVFMLTHQIRKKFFSYKQWKEIEEKYLFFFQQPDIEDFF